jgi:hypothetical protein
MKTAQLMKKGCQMATTEAVSKHQKLDVPVPETTENPSMRCAMQR